MTSHFSGLEQEGQLSGKYHGMSLEQEGQLPGKYHGMKQTIKCLYYL